MYDDKADFGYSLLYFPDFFFLVFMDIFCLLGCKQKKKILLALRAPVGVKFFYIGPV